MSTDPYISIHGHRYIHWCDVLKPEHEAMVEACKMYNIPYRVFKHQDGFKQLFVREDKTDLLT